MTPVAILVKDRFHPGRFIARLKGRLQVFFKHELRSLADLFSAFSGLGGPASGVCLRYEMLGLSDTLCLERMNLPPPGKLLLPSSLPYRLAGTLSVSALLSLGGVALALPQGYESVEGNIQFQQSGNTLNISTQAQQSIAQYQQFNVGQGETVNFNLPSAQSAILNRVVGPDASQIMGKINSNGQVFLTNPNGIVFGQGAQVNVAGLLASTLNISNQDFMAGQYTFKQESGKGSAKVQNDGSITVEKFALLAGGAVENTGTISAGSINLAVGKQLSVAVDSNLSIAVTVDESLQAEVQGAQSAISNSGTLSANGGAVQAQAKLTQGLYERSINNTGHIEAKGLGEITGEVILQADTGIVQQAGSIDVGNQTGKGGNITVLGESIRLTEGSVTDASGKTGGGAILIGGDYQGQGALPHAKDVMVESGAVIKANATQQGNGGKVVLWSDGKTWFGGRIEAKGGAVSGDGGLVETSAKGQLGVWGQVDASAVNGKGGEWLLDPSDVVFVQGSGNSVPGGGGMVNPSADTYQIDTNSIQAALNAGNSVTITTANGSGTQAGNITTSGTITINKTSGGDATLTLKADNNINLTNTTISSSSGKLHTVLWSDSDNSSAGAISLTNSSITSNGGDIHLAGGLDDGSNGGVANDGRPDGYAIGTISNVVGISFSDMDLSSGAGQIIIRGNGYSNVSLSNLIGVRLISTSLLQSTSGNISIYGQSGMGAADNTGIYLFNNGTGLTSVSGNILLVGQSRGTTTNNWGIAVSVGANIATTGTGPSAGTITLAGTGGNGTTGGRGVYISGASINSVDGDITIAGQGGNGSSTGSHPGIMLFNNAQIISTGDSQIVLTGIKGESGSRDLETTTGTIVIGGPAASGNVFINADNLSLANLNVQTVGNIIIKPRTANTTIGIMGGTGTLNLNSTTLGYFNPGNKLIIGDSAAGTGTITIGAWNLSGKTYGVEVYGGTVDFTGAVQWNHANNLLFHSRAGDLMIDQTFTKTGGGTSTLTFKSANTITQTANITSSSGALNAILWSDSDNSGAGAIALTNASITSNGGDIILAGGADTNADDRPDGYAFGTSSNLTGVRLNNSDLTAGAGSILLKGQGAVTATASSSHGVVLAATSDIQSTSGNITVYGVGGSSATNNNFGISLGTTGDRLRTVSGAITLTGQGGTGTGVTNHGISIMNGAEIASTGTGASVGAITLTGTGGNGGFSYGIYVAVTDSKISTVDADILLTGTGGTSGNENYGMMLSAGGSIASTGTGANAGNITLTGTGGNTSGTDNFGIRMSNYIISTVDGDISLTGTANGTGARQKGLYIRTGSSILSSGTGASAGRITLNGIGANGVNNNIGIEIADANTRISSVDGNITINGQGGNGSSGGSNYGVVIGYQNALVESTGTGAYAAAITITGTGGTGTGSDHGIQIGDGGVRSVEGDMTLTGVGGNIGYNSIGIVLGSLGYITSTGAGTGAAKITLDGTGGVGTGFGWGIHLYNVNNTSIQISSIDGDITVNAQAQTSSAFFAEHGGKIASTGTGANAADITINTTGTGGISLRHTGTYIATVDGDINIHSTIASGGSAIGMEIYDRAIISSTGIGSNAGNINITSTSLLSHGLYVSNNGTAIQTVDGNITINATGISGALLFANDGKLLSTGSGNLTLTGYDTSGSSDIRTLTGNIVFGGALATGNITLIADSLSLSPLTATTTGNIIIKPRTASTTIGIMGGAGTLSLSSTYLGYFNPGNKLIIGDSAAGTGLVTIGAWDLTGKTYGVEVYGGTVDLTGAMTWNQANNLLFHSRSGDLILDQNFTKSGTADSTLTLKASGSIYTSGTRSITATGTGKLHTIVWSDSDANQDGYIQLNNTTITSNGGDVVLAGGLDNGANGGITSDGRPDNYARGNASWLYGVYTSFTDINAGTGDITVQGHGFNNAALSGLRGTWLWAGTYQTTTGNIKITGVGGSGISNNYGIRFGNSGYSGTLVTTTGGNITFTGIGQGSHDNNYGIIMAGGGQTIRSTGTGSSLGNIVISGTAGGTGISGWGTLISSAASVVSTIDANITITGTGASGSSGNHGIQIVNDADIVSTGNSTITLTGIRGDNSSSTYDIYTTGSTVTVGGITATGDQIFVADKVSFSDFSAQTSGSITIKPRTTSTTIGIMGGTGTLNLNSSTLGYFNPGNKLIIGDSAAGTGTVTIGAWDLTGKTYGVEVYGGTVDLAGAMTWNQANNLLFHSRTGDLAIDQTFTKTGGGTSTLTFKAGNTITQTANISSSSGTLNTILWSDSDNSGAGAIALTNVSITSNGGYIHLAGGLDDGSNGGVANDGRPDGFAWGTASNDDGIALSNSNLTSDAGYILLRGHGQNNPAITRQYGIHVAAGAMLQSTSGNISLTGIGGDGNNFNFGVLITGAGSGITTSQGTITVAGTGGNNSGTNIGAYVHGGAIVSSTGTGNINFIGTGGNGINGNVGIRVEGTGSAITATNGNINLIGQANGSGSSNYGILIYLGGRVTTSGTGQINLTGTGGAGTSDNYGVLVQSVNSLVGSTNGNITITGQGGNGSSTGNVGIFLLSGGQIASTGSALLNLTGTGGSGTSYNYGICLNGADSLISSVNGNVTLTAQAGGNGSSFGNFGLILSNGGQITSTGSASLNLTGTGGVGTSSNFGIYLNGAGTAISSVNGHVTVTGQGGNGSSGGNHGLYLYDGAKLISTGNAIIALIGTGGNGVNDNYGIYLSNGGYITSQSSGSINLSGYGGQGTSSGNAGIFLYTGGYILSQGTGAVNLHGIGGNGTSQNYGVLVRDTGSAITSNSGNIVVTGQGGTGSGTANHGVYLYSNGAIYSTGTASISLTGTRGDTSSSTVDIRTGTGSITIGGVSAGGNIALTADYLVLGELNTQTSGNIIIKPRTASTTIGIMGGAGTLSLSSTYLGYFNPGSKLIIGDSAAGTGLVSIGAWDLTGKTYGVEVYGGTVDFTGAVQWNQANSLLFESRTGSLAIDQAFTNGGGGTSSLTFKAAGSITQFQAIIATSGALNIDYLADTDNTDSESIVLIAQTITTNNGNLSFNKAVSLTGESTLNAGSGNISFASAIDGHYGLTLSSSGNVSVSGAIGNSQRLLSLIVNHGNFISTGGTLQADSLILNNLSNSTLNLNTTANSLTGSIAGNLTLTNTQALTLGDLSGNRLEITTTSGNLTLNGRLTANSLTLVSSGAILDGNGSLNNLSVNGNATLRAAQYIGTLADPLDVQVTGGTLSVEALDQLDAVSVDISGSVSPGNTLTQLNTPPGLVIFNGLTWSQGQLDDFALLAQWMRYPLSVNPRTFGALLGRHNGAQGLNYNFIESQNNLAHPFVETQLMARSILNLDTTNHPSMALWLFSLQQRNHTFGFPNLIPQAYITSSYPHLQSVMPDFSKDSAGSWHVSYPAGQDEPVYQSYLK